MSIMYCKFCSRQVDTDFMDDCEWGTDQDPKHFKCEDCVDNDYDPTPDEEGEPPITWLERASRYEPR